MPLLRRFCDEMLADDGDGGGGDGVDGAHGYENGVWPPSPTPLLLHFQL